MAIELAAFVAAVAVVFEAVMEAAFEAAVVSSVVAANLPISVANFAAVTMATTVTYLPIRQATTIKCL